MSTRNLGSALHQLLWGFWQAMWGTETPIILGPHGQIRCPPSSLAKSGDLYCHYGHLLPRSWALAAEPRIPLWASTCLGVAAALRGHSAGIGVGSSGFESSSGGTSLKRAAAEVAASQRADGKALQRLRAAWRGGSRQHRHSKTGPLRFCLGADKQCRLALVPGGGGGRQLHSREDKAPEGWTGSGRHVRQRGGSLRLH